MKVYCKNCRWNDMVWITRCYSASKFIPKPGKIYHEDEIRDSANQDNNCLLYHRKWWKVWVR